MSLTEFLLARIAEDASWAAQIVADIGTIEGGASVVASPQRVLAQCDANRRIVAAYEEMRRDVYGDEWEEGRALGVRYALRMLAQPYVEHPDFKPEWAA